ncbi:hypothetical protein ACIA74_25370 [Streptomyces sp. NPDC051658]|uniref:hypothetical protein n=1 Tax=Streptomyces sp. NPDC051658 TaxID=3365667 RepID=UPI00378C3DED
MRGPLVPPLLPPLLERPPVITLTKTLPAPDAAYRTLLGHTLTCAACRAGAACPTVVQLGRAWRKARR